MSLAKHVFGAMVSGYRNKKLKEYYDEMSKNSPPGQGQQQTIQVGEQRIPIIIQPIMGSVPPIDIRFNQPPGMAGQAGPQGPPGAPGQPGAAFQGPGQPMTQPSVQQLAESKISQDELAKEIITSKGRKAVNLGYDIPEIGGKTKMATSKEEATPLKQIIYPLIPSKPAKGEAILAYAKVFWEPKANRYMYQVVEPQLTDKVKGILNKIKELLEEKLDVDFSRLKLSEATDYLRTEIDKLIVYYKFELAGQERTILQYFIERDFMGLGKIEPIMHDTQIEDISCDGIGIPIFIFHRNPELGSVVTNIVFNDGEELDSFITRLAQLSGKSISVAEPLLDGALPDGSRLQATLATDIARKGSNFTIRKFSEEPLTPVHLLKYKTVDVKSLAYLWLAVDYGRSILVSGGTASGKTSFLNALSLFIRPDKKIVSIEDTAELKLPHPHWVPTVARTTIASSNSSNEIDMFKLLSESMRQRPDYIIVGEVRGQEAFVLFQQMATGHPSYATIHAENMDKLVDRLTTAPISLPKTLIGSLDLIVFMLRVRYKDKFVRRVNEVVEMIEFDSSDPRPTTNTIFKWNPSNDLIEVSSKSTLIKKIVDATGMKGQEVLDELKRRMIVLAWMRDMNITEYKEVYKIVNMYYYYPNRVLAAISGEA